MKLINVYNVNQKLMVINIIYLLIVYVVKKVKCMILVLHNVLQLIIQHIQIVLMLVLLIMPVFVQNVVQQHTLQVPVHKYVVLVVNIMMEQHHVVILQ